MRILGRQFSIFGGGMRRVEFVLPLVRGKDVLDVGVVQHTADAATAQNWLHRHVAAAARHCIGIDAASDGIARLREMGFNVAVADAQDFDLGCKFDVVLAGDVVEHLHDLSGFFRSIRQHLRTDGVLVLLTANPWFAVRWLQAMRGAVYENPEHTAWYSPGTLKELLNRFDFELDRVEFGSSENFLYRIPLVPGVLKHTSVWVVATAK